MRPRVVTNSYNKTK